MDKDQRLQALLQAIRNYDTETSMLHQTVADRVGLSLTCLECIDFLARFGPMPAGRLAELTGLTTGAITGVIDRLEKAGFARRFSDAKDRRLTIIELVWNDETERNLTEIFIPLSKKLESLAAAYSEDELALLVEFISKAAEISQAESVRLRKEKQTVSRTQ